MAEDYDDYYSDSEEGIGEEIKIPDVGDNYRGLVAPITEADVKERRRLLRERRARHVVDVPEDQMNKITDAYRSIYGKDPKSLLLRQPHAAEEYDDYGNLERVNPFKRAADRKSAAEANKNTLRAKIKEITGRNDLEGWEMDQIAAAARRRNTATDKARNRAIRAAMRKRGILEPIPKKGTPEYDQLVADRQQRKYRSRVHQYYPRFITDKAFDEYLDKNEIRGETTYDDPVYDDFIDARTHEPIFKNWVKKTPQQLSVAERNRAAMLFGEMSGLLGLHPKYDRRFLTAASAKAALNDREGKYYNYQMYDMDNDKRSPGTLVVSRKDNGQIIAVDGYLLNDAKESAEVQRLRDMIYFNENPTPGQRKMKPKSAFMKEHKLMKTKKSVGLKAVKEFVEEYITTKLWTQTNERGQQEPLILTPPSTRWNPKTRKNEAVSSLYMIVSIPLSSSSGSSSSSTDTFKQIDSYIVPLIAWRSIISSVAELLTNMYIYPDISWDEIGLGAFKGAFLDQRFNDKYPPDNAQSYYNHWMKTYTNDTVEAYVLANKYVQKYIAEWINANRNNKSLQPTLQILINTVCLFHMNGADIDARFAGIKDVDDRGNRYTLTDLITSFYELEPKYYFTNGTPEIPVYNSLTARSWEKVVKDWRVAYMGNNLVASLKRSDVKHFEYDPQTRQSTLRDYGYIGNYVAPKRRRLMQVQQYEDVSEDTTDDDDFKGPTSSSSSSSSINPLLLTPTQTVQQQIPVQQPLNFSQLSTEAPAFVPQRMPRINRNMPLIGPSRKMHP